MTQAQLLNTASDLRRIANWMAREETNKIDLINNLLMEIKDKKIKKFVEKFQENIQPEEAFKNKTKRNYFAEQMLTASIILQNRGISGIR